MPVDEKPPAMPGDIYLYAKMEVYMGVIDNAVQWATDIANDDSHGYSQSVRWGPHYDCSSFVITAYQNSGVPVKDNGMTYTREIKITHSRSSARNTSKRGICSR